MGRRHKLRVHSDDTSTYVEESFEVMFVPEEEIQQVNWV